MHSLLSRHLTIFLYFYIGISSVLSCSEEFQNINPVGKFFPNIQGNALDGKLWQLPKALAGQPSLLLLGYQQESQFDIDRWLIALDMRKVQVKLYEVPTIKGWVPRLISGRINEGMRSGIPKELWGAVITVYKDGERLQKFTGNINPRNARIILLGPQGQVRFFSDKGFAVPSLNQLIKEFDLLKTASQTN